MLGFNKSFASPFPGSAWQYTLNNGVNDDGLSPAAELSPLRGPYFDSSASKNVTALVGKTAYLNCRVRNLGNKTVSSLG